MARLRVAKVSKKAAFGKAKFEEAKHRRDQGGKFADKPGTGDDASRKGGSPALNSVGLTKESRVTIGGQSRTVNEWMTGGARLQAKEIAEGVKRGMYKVEGQVRATVSIVAP